LIRIGTVIDGRFHVRRRLGSGMSGEIVAAWDSQRGQEVAVKLQHPRSFESTRSYSSLGLCIVEEAEIGESLSGIRGIPEVYRHGIHLGRRYAAIELIDGVTLANVTEQRRPANSDTVAAVIGQLCEILEPVHARGVVHRDIKLDNVMVGHDGEVRLLDLGIAVRVDEDLSDFISGTPGYAPPEQYTGQKLTPRADVYALGSVLFEMSVMSLPYAEQDGRPDRQVEPFRAGLLDTMHDGLRSLGLSMVAWNPADRPASVSEVLDVLRPMLPVPGSPRHPKAPRPDPAGWYRNRIPAG
jgi:eukaryotic-like serine/threonine-protein kinase